MKKKIMAVLLSFCMFISGLATPIQAVSDEIVRNKVSDENKEDSAVNPNAEEENTAEGNTEEEKIEEEKTESNEEENAGESGGRNAVTPQLYADAGPFNISGEEGSYEASYDEATAQLKVTRAQQSGFFTITTNSTTVSSRILFDVSQENLYVTLQNVNIQILDGTNSPIEVTGVSSGHKLYLVIAGNNTIRSNALNKAVIANHSCPIEISGSGTLEVGFVFAESGASTTAARIGGDEGETGKNITISSGSILLNSYPGGILEEAKGAMIGGGSNASGENIKISGGNINASRSVPSNEDVGAGIGGGVNSYAENIEITGGNFNLETRTSSSGAVQADLIGRGGGTASSSNIYISGGTFNNKWPLGPLAEGYFEVGGMPCVSREDSTPVYRMDLCPEGAGQEVPVTAININGEIYTGYNLTGAKTVLLDYASSAVGIRVYLPASVNGKAAGVQSITTSAGTYDYIDDMLNFLPVKENSAVAKFVPKSNYKTATYYMNDGSSDDVIYQKIGYRINGGNWPSFPENPQREGGYAFNLWSTDKTKKGYMVDYLSDVLDKLEPSQNLDLYAHWLKTNFIYDQTKGELTETQDEDGTTIMSAVPKEGNVVSGYYMECNGKAVNDSEVFLSSFEPPVLTDNGNLNIHPVTELDALDNGEEMGVHIIFGKTLGEYNGLQMAEFMEPGASEKTATVMSNVVYENDDYVNYYTNSEYIVPEKITTPSGEYTITGISDMAFMSLSNTRRIILPKTISYFGMYAFAQISNANAPKLTTISTDPNSYDPILDFSEVSFNIMGPSLLMMYSDSGACKFETIKLPNDLTEIPSQFMNMAFDGDFTLDLSNTKVETIGESGLYASSSSFTVILPSTVKKIARYGIGHDLFSETETGGKLTCTFLSIDNIEHFVLQDGALYGRSGVTIEATSHETEFFEDWIAKQPESGVKYKYQEMGGVVKQMVEGGDCTVTFSKPSRNDYFYSNGETVTVDLNYDTAKYDVKNIKATTSSGFNIELTPNEPGKQYSFVFPNPFYAYSVTVQVELAEMFNVEIPAFDYGSVTANKTRAASGEMIELTVTPNKNYKLTEGSLEVTYGEGQKITPEYNEESGKYEFTMPETDAAVNAAFELSIIPVSGAVNIVGDILPTETITANVTGFEFEGERVPLSYQWYLDGVEIQGMTEASYVVKESDLNHNLSVKAIAEEIYSGSAESNVCVVKNTRVEIQTSRAPLDTFSIYAYDNSATSLLAQVRSNELTVSGNDKNINSKSYTMRKKDGIWQCTGSIRDFHAAIVGSSDYAAGNFIAEIKKRTQIVGEAEFRMPGIHYGETTITDNGNGTLTVRTEASLDEQLKGLAEFTETYIAVGTAPNPLADAEFIPARLVEGTTNVYEATVGMNEHAGKTEGYFIIPWFKDTRSVVDFDWYQDIDIEAPFENPEVYTEVNEEESEATITVTNTRLQQGESMAVGVYTKDGDYQELKIIDMKLVPHTTTYEAKIGIDEYKDITAPGITDSFNRTGTFYAQVAHFNSSGGFDLIGQQQSYTFTPTKFTYWETTYNSNKTEAEVTATIESVPNAKFKEVAVVVAEGASKVDNPKWYPMEYDEESGEAYIALENLPAGATLWLWAEEAPISEGGRGTLVFCDSADTPS